MTIIRFRSQANTCSAAFARGAALWLCILLLGLLAIAQVAHVHKNVTQAEHCTLCMALHSVAPTAIVAVLVLWVPKQWIAPAAVSSIPLRSEARTFFIRPPPADFSLPHSR